MRKITFAVLSAMPFVFSTPALAQEQHRQLEAHMHGHGKFNIAIEGKKVSMELEVPGMDIVGFEHKPSTNEQKTAMQAAKKRLHEDVMSLFVLSREAECQLVSSKVEIPDHQYEDEEGKGEHKGEHEEEEHSEFHAQYQFECNNPAKLSSIKFVFFERFRNAKELEVSVIGDKSQRVQTVTRETPVLNGLSK